MEVLIASGRKHARRNNNALSDMVRDQLTAAGITLEDRQDGTIWRRNVMKMKPQIAGR